MTSIYICGAWTEQHQRARPMIAKVREAGFRVTTDWTQAEGDVCACGHPRRDHYKPSGDPYVEWRGDCEPCSLCACANFNGIGVGGDSQLTDADRIKYAQADLDGVLQADIVWLLAANDKGACGSWVELGAALALRETSELRGPRRPEIVVSGLKWKRTIFTELADKTFLSDDAALAYIVGVGMHRGVL